MAEEPTIEVTDPYYSEHSGAEVDAAIAAVAGKAESDLSNVPDAAVLWRHLEAAIMAQFSSLDTDKAESDLSNVTSGSVTPGLLSTDLLALSLIHI